MHEVMLAGRILNTLREISDKHRAKVVKVNVRIGELNEPKGVKLWLKKLGGEQFKSTEFNIIPVPLEVSCKCGYSGKVESVAHYHSPEPELEIACPACGGHELELATGRELEIVNVELEKGEK
jgi:Zn finger protein HypA/HybF involved in hydrogenase expression